MVPRCASDMSPCAESKIVPSLPARAKPRRPKPGPRIRRWPGPSTAHLRAPRAGAPAARARLSSRRADDAAARSRKESIAPTGTMVSNPVKGIMSRRNPRKISRARPAGRVSSTTRRSDRGSRTGRRGSLPAVTYASRIFSRRRRSAGPMPRSDTEKHNRMRNHARFVKSRRSA